MADSLSCRPPNVVYDILKVSGKVLFSLAPEDQTAQIQTNETWKPRLAGLADEYMQELAFSISASGSYTAQRQTSSAMSACRKQQDSMNRSASTDLTVQG
jgi:hypothetical protein